MTEYTVTREVLDSFGSIADSEQIETFFCEEDARVKASALKKAEGSEEIRFSISCEEYDEDGEIKDIYFIESEEL